MKKELALAVVIAVAFSGCWKRKDSCIEKTRKESTSTNVDIPVAGFNDEEILFTQEIGQLDNFDDAFDLTALNNDEIDLREDQADDFAWIHEPYQQDFKSVYFDFDKSDIREDQEGVIDYNIARAKDVIAENPDTSIVFVVEGHADHAAGSDVYNLALSEKRAKQIMDRFIAAGVPQHLIKIVGRGSEMPAIVDGRAVDGDRNAQWPNRRSEIRFVVS